MDFDADRIYYSHQNLHQQQPGVDGAPAQQNQQSTSNDRDRLFEDEEERAVDSDALRRHFREFLSEFTGCHCLVYLLTM